MLLLLHSTHWLKFWKHACAACFILLLLTACGSVSLIEKKTETSSEGDPNKKNPEVVDFGSTSSNKPSLLEPLLKSTPNNSLQIGGIADDGTGHIIFTNRATHSIYFMALKGAFAHVPVVPLTPPIESISSISAHPLGGYLITEQTSARVVWIKNTGEFELIPNRKTTPWVEPTAAIADKAGNIYIADSATHTLHRVDANRNSTILAGVYNQSGNEDGAAGLARFAAPFALALDSKGNLFVADTGNNAIRVIDPTSTVRTVLPVEGMELKRPSGLLITPQDELIVSDTLQHVLWIVRKDGAIQLLAGESQISGYIDGNQKVARFNRPLGLAMDSLGNILVADSRNQAIRSISLITANVTTLLHNGITNIAGITLSDQDKLLYPNTLASLAEDGILINDLARDELLQFWPQGSSGKPLTGTGTAGAMDGLLSEASFNTPSGIVGDSKGNLYIADSENHLIRKISTDGIVSTFAGKAKSPGWVDGSATEARFNVPRGLAIDGIDNIYVADSHNHAIRRVSPDGQVVTLAGQPDNTGDADGPANIAQFSYPSNLVIDSLGRLIVADTYNHTIRLIYFDDASHGFKVSTIAGLAQHSGFINGSPQNSRFYFPTDLSISPTGDIDIADYGNHAIRRISGQNGSVSTLFKDPQLRFPNILRWINANLYMNALNQFSVVSAEELTKYALEQNALH